MICNGSWELACVHRSFLKPDTKVQSVWFRAIDVIEDMSMIYTTMEVKELQTRKSSPPEAEQPVTKLDVNSRNPENSRIEECSFDNFCATGAWKNWLLFFCWIFFLWSKPFLRKKKQFRKKKGKKRNERSCQQKNWVTAFAERARFSLLCWFSFVKSRLGWVLLCQIQKSKTWKKKKREQEETRKVSKATSILRLWHGTDISPESKNAPIWFWPSWASLHAGVWNSSTWNHINSSVRFSPMAHF